MTGPGHSILFPPLIIFILVADSVEAFLGTRYALGRSRASRHLWQYLPLASSRQRWEESEASDAHIFLRFSPLIGGPAFLPLHAEVIVAVNDAGGEQPEQKMDTICIRRANDFSSTSLLRELKLHRFDFLPKNPTDPSTVFRLMSLQGVPGRVRYRTYERRTALEGSDKIQTNSSDGKGQDGRGITVLIPLSYGKVTANDVVAAAVRFNEDYRNSLFKDLQLIGGKNCLSFALDLLSHIEASTGIQKTITMYRFDMK